MRKITFRNAIGAEMVITNSAPFLLQTFTEDKSVDIYNVKGSGQDGLTYLDNTLNRNDLSMDFYIISKSKEELINYRDKILKQFNPKLGEGFLTYEDDVKKRVIKCIINKLPAFTVVKDSESMVGSCLISIEADNPYWTDVEEIKSEIAVWLGDFQFDLEIPEESGIEMGHKELNVIAKIDNTGDVECGIRIEFSPLARVVNPSLLNLYTKEYIKINKTINVGEKIIITTHPGNKNIQLDSNGIITNAFNYVDLNSTFMQLKTGNNHFRYYADENPDNLETSIYYTPRYLGV